MGKNTVAKMLPTLSTTVSEKRFTNNSVRPTSIRQMKRAGLEDREVIFVSGHKDPKTLANYDPLPTWEKRRKMANAIASGSRSSTTSEPSPSTSTSNDASPSPSTSTSNNASANASADASADEMSENDDSGQDGFLVPEDLITYMDFDPEKINVEVKKTSDKKEDKNSKNENKSVKKQVQIDGDHSKDFQLTQGTSTNAQNDPILLLLRREQELSAQESARKDKETATRLELLSNYINSKQ